MRVRSLNDLEGDALAVGHEGDPNLLSILQLFWVDLDAVEGFCPNLNLLLGRGS